MEPAPRVIPELATARLVLRAFKAGDVDALHRILGGKDVLRYFPKSDPPTRERVEVMVSRTLERADTPAIAPGREGTP